ncbi:hypothetical protein EYZ11_007757 [Aspergillus tanneri]|uniref:Uncharacterized protein n=1 Tax=Aspergillus tanneri TaxID=1220188 RepID=A0A4S3JCJ7_9EURO|nr:hypothetical protein EYZ11_007757 [Aspergillus tanneri]
MALYRLAPNQYTCITTEQSH